MIRITKSWLVALVALALVGGAACDKGKGKDGSGGGAGGGVAGAAAVGDDLSLIPVDSEMVIGLNFGQLQQSALWKQYSPKFMDKVSGKLAEFKTACGFDPITSFKSITMGMKNLSDQPGAKPSGVFVARGLDKGKTLSCIDKYKAEAAKQGNEITVDGAVILVKEKNGDVTATMFVDDSTLVAVVGPNASEDAVKAAAKGGSTLKTSQTFVDMFSKINAGDSLWMVINGNSGLLDKAGALGAKPKAVFGSINITDGLALDARVRMGTPDEANSLVTMAKGQIDNPQVKQMFDKLDVSGDGPDVHITVSMSSQKLQSLVAMVGGLMGGLMSGGMGGGDTPPSP